MKIFISYRRADTQATAGRMAQFLDGIPAVDETFLDVDDIPVGEDFERRIGRRLERASHVLVLIGTAWRGEGAGGGPRILEDNDMVRREVRLALARGAKVVPVVLDAARMPQPAELPEDLKPLAGLNAFSLRTSHFNEDMDDLLDALAGRSTGRRSRWRRPPLAPAGIALRVLGGLAAGALLLVGLALANRYLTDCYDLVCTLRTRLGLAGDDEARGLLATIAVAVLAAAALAPFLPRALRRLRG